MLGALASPSQNTNAPMGVAGSSVGLHPCRLCSSYRREDGVDNGGCSFYVVRGSSCEISQITDYKIEKLRSVFATHGLSEILVTDNGSVFTSAKFDKFVRRNGIKHLTSAPYHPASNRLAEKTVQTVKAALKKATTGTSLESVISRFLFQYQLTPHTTTGVSPAKLLMNRKPHSRLDILYPDVSSRVRDHQGTQKANHNCHSCQR